MQTDELLRELLIFITSEEWDDELFRSRAATLAGHIREKLAELEDDGK